MQNPPISFQDNPALSLQCTLHPLIFSDCGDMQTTLSWNDTQTDKTTTICLWGSTLQSIMRPWKLQAQCLHCLETIQLSYNLAYAQIVHMPIVLLCLLVTESFYGAQIAGLHYTATKLEGNNYPMCLCAAVLCIWLHWFVYNIAVYTCSCQKNWLFRAFLLENCLLE